MSVIDILFRVDTICKKYEKYDIDKLRSNNASSDDAFVQLYSNFESQIELATQKLEVAGRETNRATVVALNAEVRRIKARLIDDLPKLQKLAHKKVKGVSNEELEARADLVITLPDRIQAIGENTTKGWGGAGGASSSHKNIKFDSDGQVDEAYFQETEESNKFRQEIELRKLKQNEGLAVISEGLGTLKDLAKDMNEEMDRQVPLMDEIETKVDKASSDLRRTNVRLKETILELRSTRNFIIDIILMCILLGIVSYLYNILR